MSIFGKGKIEPAQYLDEPQNKLAMTTLKSGFAAMGYMVPNFRRANANTQLKNFGLDAEDRFFIIQKASDMIFRDDPHRALEALSEKIDVTGSYMILSYLLTGVDDEV